MLNASMCSSGFGSPCGLGTGDRFYSRILSGGVGGWGWGWGGVLLHRVEHPSMGDVKNPDISGTIMTVCKTMCQRNLLYPGCFLSRCFSFFFDIWRVLRMLECVPSHGRPGNEEQQRTKKRKLLSGRVTWWRVPINLLFYLLIFS